MNSSIWPVDGTLKGTTYPVQRGPGSNDNKGVVHIPGLEPHHPKQFSIMPLVVGRRTYPTSELQSMYSMASADWVSSELTKLVQNVSWLNQVRNKEWNIIFFKIALLEFNRLIPASFYWSKHL